MVLILPAMFGLTLVGEGVTKLVHEESGGWISVIFGVVMILIVVVAFIFFKSILG
jgi:hypothetical protein